MVKLDWELDLVYFVVVVVLDKLMYLGEETL